MVSKKYIFENGKHTVQNIQNAKLISNFLKNFQKLKNSDGISCSFPPEMAGTNLIKLDWSQAELEKMTCAHSPQPTVVDWPKNQTVLFGRSLTLECVAMAFGGEPTFVWTKDRRIIEPFQINNRINVEKVIPNVHPMKYEFS